MLRKKRRRRRGVVERVCDGIDLVGLVAELLGQGWRLVTAPVRLLVDL